MSERPETRCLNPLQAGARFAALLACLFLFSATAKATDLDPFITFSASPPGLTFSWDDLGPTTYIAALSTSASFVTTLFSETLSDNTSTYFVLSPGNTHYFKVKLSTEPDTEYAYSTATVVNASSASGFIYSTVESSITATLTAAWNTNGSQYWVHYNVEASSGTLYEYGGDKSSTGTFIGFMILSGLFANTTYYVKVRAIDIAGDPTAYSGFSPESTLATKPPGAGASVYQASITVTWTALPGSPQPESCEGYLLDLSTSSLNFKGVTYSSGTSDVGSSALSITGLNPNTTYYYRLGSLNWSQTTNFMDGASFVTLTDSPSPIQVLSVYESSSTLGWPAYPQAPPSSSAFGYRLEASTASNFTGTIRSSSTYDVLSSTLTVENLNANTTYYFRMGALNWSGTPTYSAESSTVTIAQTVDIDTIETSHSDKSITAIWTPLNESPQKDSCEGYRLEASTAEDFTGTIYSSTTFDSNVSSLTIVDLWPNTAYYMRMASLNWNLHPNYLEFTSTVTTLTGPLLPALSIDGIYLSSISVSWTPLLCDGYVLEASTGAFPNTYTGNKSSLTTNGNFSSLFIISLDTNTVYFLRVGTIFTDATGYTTTSPPSTSTLALGLNDQQIAGVFQTSITVNWNTLPESPPVASARGYCLAASISADFQGMSFSSTTYDVKLGTLTVKSLTPNTSYYLRAGSLNQNYFPNYVTTSVTSTLANVPIESDYSGLAANAITVNWGANSNPDDTLYFVEISSGPLPNSYASYKSSYSYTVSVPFGGLLQNTTYYAMVKAINRHGLPTVPVPFQQSMPTLADDPVSLPYTGLGVSSVTLNWDPDSNPPGETFYVAAISKNSSFAPPVLSSKTLTLSATFQNLASNTPYYLQVSALNHTGIATTPTSLGAVLTYPAPPGSAVSTFTNVMLDAFTVNWQANGNSTMTVYEVEISIVYEELTSTESFSFLYSSAATNPPALSAYTTGFTKLTLGTTYYARVRAKGLSGMKSHFVDMGPVQTLFQKRKNIIYNIPGSVTLSISYGNITVDVPANTFGSSLYMYIETVLAPPSAPCPAANLTPLATPRGIRVWVDPKLHPVKPLTITIPYRPSDLAAGDDKARFVLARYDPARNIWTPLASVSNPDNSVTAKTWHLSMFQIMVSHAPDTLKNAKIFPNPFAPSSGDGIVQFTNLPPRTKLRIFTFLGELIHKTKADANGVATWHGKNRHGAKVASGVYLVLLEKENSSERKILKVALER